MGLIWEDEEEEEKCPAAEDLNLSELKFRKLGEHIEGGDDRSKVSIKSDVRGTTKMGQNEI